MSGISKSQVSRLCGEIDDNIQSFLDRPLEGDWPYLWLDATYLKVRQAGRIVSVAVTVAVAVNDQGRREVLGMAIGASEAETFWTGFLRSLTRRGLRGVKLVIADDHKGLKAAATRILGATAQRCRVHFMRNLLAHAGKQGRRVVSAFVATAFAQDDADSAAAQWRLVADQLKPKAPKLAALMDEAQHDVLAYMSFPREHRQKLHSTNPLERLNGEIKRRTNVVGIFPNEDAITRLVGAILLEQNDEWAVSRRYMTLESIAQTSDNLTLKLPTWQPERPGPTRRIPRRTPSSYTTCRDTIIDSAARVSGGAIIMAKGNDGNYLQHCVEVEAAGRLTQVDAQGRVHIALAHGMEPCESFEALKWGQSGKLIQNALEEAGGQRRLDERSIVTAYRETKASAEKYPNSAKLLRTVVGVEKLSGGITEIEPAKHAKLVRAWSGTAIKTACSSWRREIEAGGILSRPDELRTPWLFTMDPMTYSKESGSEDSDKLHKRDHCCPVN